jgi:hypothetical protein
MITLPYDIEDSMKLQPFVSGLGVVEGCATDSFIA